MPALRLADPCALFIARSWRIDTGRARLRAAA
jgi:hypothetical protein